MGFFLYDTGYTMPGSLYCFFLCCALLLIGVKGEYATGEFSHPRAIQPIVRCQFRPWGEGQKNPMGLHLDFHSMLWIPKLGDVPQKKYIGRRRGCLQEG